MAVFKRNLIIYQGSTFDPSFTWKAGDPAAPVDLTGCTARMQIRESLTAADPLVTLTTENGGITLGGDTGTIELLIAAAASAAFTWTEGVYDLEIVFADGKVKRKMEGRVTVKPEVTRS